ncbi:MAG: ketoacyl-ACP synthase III [Clostridiaceae bacterium]|nr:ketoacyl-ACP synthase III [Clostridiaceae bacterium]
MIVFVSDTPEYTAPTNAMLINNALHAKNAHVVYDMNVNCVGMVVAMDQVSRVIKTDPKIKHALLVGSLFVSSIARDDDIFTYSAVADAAVAIVLKHTQDEVKRGVIDSAYFTDSKDSHIVLSPVCGMSKVLLNYDVDLNDRKLLQRPLDASFFSINWAKLVKNLLSAHNLVPDDIDYYFFSQYTKTEVMKTAALLGVDFEEKFVYVGDKYGYTGNTSPVLAYHEAYATGLLEQNQKYIFCSVGTGCIMSAVLYIS